MARRRKRLLPGAHIREDKRSGSAYRGPMEIEIVRSYRKLVKPEDLNAANTLFGGTLMAWIDEACVLYAMCQMQTRRVVTLKFSEVLLKTPSKQGDILEFVCQPVRSGTTSFTVACQVTTKVVAPGEESRTIAACEVVFVAVNEDGRPEPYHARGRSVTERRTVPGTAT